MGTQHFKKPHFQRSVLHRLDLTHFRQSRSVTFCHNELSPSFEIQGSENEALQNMPFWKRLVSKQEFSKQRSELPLVKVTLPAWNRIWNSGWPGLEFQIIE